MCGFESRRFLLPSSPSLFFGSASPRILYREYGWYELSNLMGKANHNTIKLSVVLENCLGSTSILRVQTTTSFYQLFPSDGTNGEMDLRALASHFNNKPIHELIPSDQTNREMDLRP